MIKRSSDTPHERRVLVSIQYLRGIAASMVVIHHSAENYDNSPINRFDFGQSGVAIFFVISGFIIWTSSRNETVEQFVKRRITRIVPMYWLALAVVLAIGVHSWGKPIFSLTAIICSMLFIPYFAATHNITPFPVLVPGWTLNFEIFFYAVFALGMRLRRPLLFSGGVMSGLFICGKFFHFSSAPLVLYTNWLSILFVVGLVIGKIRPYTWLTAALWPLGLLLTLGFQFVSFPQAALAGGVLLLVVGVTAQENVWGWPRVPALEALGNASYSIYLFHMPVLFILNFAQQKISVAEPPWQIFSLLSVGLSWAVGLIMHRYVEKPIGNILRGL